MNYQPRHVEESSYSTKLCHSDQIFNFSTVSLGGNQRELARQKNAKKQSDMHKGKRNDGLSGAARKQR